MGLLSFFKKNAKQSDYDLINDDSSSERADFVRKRQEEGIGIKSSLIEYAAIEKGLKVKRLSRRLILVQDKDGNNLAFNNMNGIHSSRIGMNICDRKHDTRYVLKESGLKVVESKRFGFDELAQAIKYAKELGFPVVVKPTSLSRGRGVSTNIKNEEQFKKAWKYAYSAYKKNKEKRSVIVERHVKGDDYRVFVVDDKVISVTHRKKANIIGDGKSTILELIKKKNKERSKNPYLSNHLISEDPNELDHLDEYNYSLDYIPKAGEEVVLRKQSNISVGGDSIDVTDEIHPEFREIAIQSVKAIPGIKYAGVDFIAEDITKKPTKVEYVVSEIEFSPAPIAQFPYRGKARDVAGAVMDYYLAKNNN